MSARSRQPRSTPGMAGRILRPAARVHEARCVLGMNLIEVRIFPPASPTVHATPYHSAPYLGGTHHAIPSRPAPVTRPDVRERRHALVGGPSPGRVRGQERLVRILGPLVERIDAGVAPGDPRPGERHGDGGHPASPVSGQLLLHLVTG